MLVGYMARLDVDLIVRDFNFLNSQLFIPGSSAEIPGYYIYNTSNVSSVVVLRPDGTAESLVRYPQAYWRVDSSSRIYFSELSERDDENPQFDLFGTIKNGILEENQGDYVNEYRKVDVPSRLQLRRQ